MTRSFDVLSDYRAMMDEAGVTRGLLVATSAVRDASNGEEFLDEARRRTGVDARILNGHEEAAYSYVGCHGRTPGRTLERRRSSTWAADRPNWR